MRNCAFQLALIVQAAVLVNSAHFAAKTKDGVSGDAKLDDRAVQQQKESAKQVGMMRREPKRLSAEEALDKGAASFKEDASDKEEVVQKHQLSEDEQAELDDVEMQDKAEAETKPPSTVAVNAKGHQPAGDRDAKHSGVESMAQTDSSKSLEKSVRDKVEKAHIEAVQKAEDRIHAAALAAGIAAFAAAEADSAKKKAKGPHVIADESTQNEKRAVEGSAAGLTQEAQAVLEGLEAGQTQDEAAYDAKNGIVHMRGTDDTKKNPAKLSNADEELYYTLFPEDRTDEGKAGVSALQQSGQKAFRIKVQVSGGKRLCLTEDNSGYKVRAEPCRRNSHRQKWYWMGSKLKNLFSRGRCLGLVHTRSHVSSQASPSERESMIQGSPLKDHVRHLSMAFYCTNGKAPLGWQLDEVGRLKSADTTHASGECMAIDEHEHFNAMVLPCPEQ